MSAINTLFLCEVDRIRQLFEGKNNYQMIVINVRVNRYIKYRQAIKDRKQFYQSYQHGNENDG